MKMIQRQKNIEERERERAPILWFIPPMPKRAKAELELKSPGARNST